MKKRKGLTKLIDESEEVTGLASRRQQRWQNDSSLWVCKDEIWKNERRRWDIYRM